MSESSQKLISVIIATYKRPQSLRAALNSVLACRVDKSFEYELIVADNNSQDETENVVKEMMPMSNGRLKYVFEARQGKSFALNTAIAQSRGKYIAMTDDDCLVEQGWLAHIAQNMGKYNVDILCGKVVPVFDGDLPAWVDMNVNIFHGPLVHFNLGEKYMDGTEKDILPTGANMIVSRQAYDQFKGIPQETRAQDTEIGYRWKKMGATIGYAPDVLVYHQTPVSRLTKSYFRKWQFLCGKNSAIIFKDSYQNARRKILNVPLWVLKKLLKSICKYIAGFFTFKDNFSNELWVWHYLGEISGLQNIKVEFENGLR